MSGPQTFPESPRPRDGSRPVPDESAPEPAARASVAVGNGNGHGNGHGNPDPNPTHPRHHAQPHGPAHGVPLPLHGPALPPGAAAPLAVPLPLIDVAGAAAPRPAVEDPGMYSRILRRSWPLMILGAVLCLTVAVVYLLQQRTTYNAETRILVLQHGGGANSPRDRDALVRVEQAEDYIHTHALILRSPRVLERAIQTVPVEKLPDWARGDKATLALAARLDVEPAENEPRIINVSLRADSRDDAVNMLEAVINSYNKFLDDTFQKKSNEVINLMTRIRDDVGKELNDLEKGYLEFRKEHPVMTVDESGRSFLVRKLDQLDNAANRARLRIMQLSMQLEQGKKLAEEGLGYAELARMLALMGGDTPDPRADFAQEIALGMPPLAASSSSAGVNLGARSRRGGVTLPGNSFDKVAAELDDIRAEIDATERFLVHLKAEFTPEKANYTERQLWEMFWDEPRNLELARQRQTALSALKRAEAASRVDSDPGAARAREVLKRVEAIAKTRFERNKDELLARLGPGERLAVTIREAESNLGLLRAEERAHLEKLEALRESHVQRLLREREQLVQLHGPDAAPVREIDRDLEIARDAGKAGAARSAKTDSMTWALLHSVEQTLKIYQSIEQQYLKQFDELLAQSGGIERTILEEANLRANLDRQRGLYETVVSQLKTTELTSDYAGANAEMLNAIAAKEVAPPYLAVLLLALFVGCGLGLGGGFLQEMLDTRIHNLDELRNILDLNILGVITTSRRLAADPAAAARVALICLEKPGSPLAESYKQIRTQYEFLRRSRNHQVVLVTSAVSGDGKTTTSSNLAISLAQAGRRVLLVDADLRRPQLSKLYNLPNPWGLGQILRDGIPPRDLVQHTRVPNLHMIACGETVNNPAELLMSGRLASVFDELRPHYDVVIVDSSPLLAITDPSIIGTEVDGVVLVLNPTRVKRQEALRAVELLRNLGTPILGVVVNGVVDAAGGYGYYGYGYYGYGYGHGRGNPYLDPRADAEDHDRPRQRADALPQPPRRE